jgi:hypothetical protein
MREERKLVSAFLRFGSREGGRRKGGRTHHGTSSRSCIAMYLKMTFHPAAHPCFSRERYTRKSGREARIVSTWEATMGSHPPQAMSLWLEVWGEEGMEETKRER